MHHLLPVHIMSHFNGLQLFFSKRVAWNSIFSYAKWMITTEPYRLKKYIKGPAFFSWFFVTGVNQERWTAFTQPKQKETSSMFPFSLICCSCWCLSTSGWLYLPSQRWLRCLLLRVLPAQQVPRLPHSGDRFPGQTCFSASRHSQSRGRPRSVQQWRNCLRGSTAGSRAGKG